MLSALVLASTFPASDLPFDPTSVMWYRSPASAWIEALPVGNGRLGGMVFGGVEAERIQLNEISMWSGGPMEADNPDAFAALAKIRSLLFKGKYREAQEEANRRLVCKGPGTSGGNAANAPYGSYQTLGDLSIEQSYPGATSEYKRSLDLRNAVATVTFVKGGVRFRREVFASERRQVIVVRLTASEPKSVSLSVALKRPERFSVTVSGNDIVMDGQLNNGTDGKGMRYRAVARVLQEGGKLSADAKAVHVDRANTVTILVAARTDFKLSQSGARNGNPYVDLVDADLKAASKMSYHQLKQSGTGQHKLWFERVKLDLGASENAKLPTDERLARFAQGESDPALVALFFQYGRYLMLCSSRPGSLPANLQGLWADTIQTPWNGDYHTDINLQMNYWLPDVAGLPECFEPFTDLVESLLENGSKTAKVHYGARGWTVHTVTNVWGYTSPGEHPGWGMTPTSGPWLINNLWDHYLFTLDKKYLSRIWPIIKGSAEFCLDWLVEDPRTKKLVSGPATSPENSFHAPDGSVVSMSMGPSIDQFLINEVFQNALDAAAELKIDDPILAEIRQAKSRLLMPKAGSDGRLMEWAEEFGETEPHHRHVSHLVGLHPCRQVTEEGTPDLFEAAKKSLDARGDTSTGWSMAWKINFWARLKDGARAYRLIRSLIKPTGSTGFNMVDGGGLYPNLFDAHPPFQIDGNFGGAAGIAEMLVQSHAGYIELLPALPREWQTGKMTGLRMRGGLTLDMAWANGMLKEAVIHPSKRIPIRIRMQPDWTASQGKVQNGMLHVLATKTSEIRIRRK